MTQAHVQLFFQMFSGKQDKSDTSYTDSFFKCSLRGATKVTQAHLQCFFKCSLGCETKVTQVLHLGEVLWISYATLNRAPFPSFFIT